MGKFVILLGPSGTGKGTVMGFLREWQRDAWRFALSTTTRAPRPREHDSVDYHFWQTAQFEQGIADGRFLEWAQVHGKHYYGTQRAEVEPWVQRWQTVIKEMDVQGVEQVWQNLPREQVLTVFLLPPSEAVLRQRIIERAPISEAELAARMESLRVEMAYAEQCDLQIVGIDGEPKKTAKKVLAQIKKNL